MPLNGALKNGTVVYQKKKKERKLEGESTKKMRKILGGKEGRYDLSTRIYV